MISTILFDLDGTLIDPKEGITQSIRYALAKLSRPLPPETNLDWCIGPPLQHNFATLLDTTDDNLIQQAVAFYRERYQAGGLFEAVVYPDIPQVLAQLRSQQKRLCLATSKPTVYARPILAHFQLDWWFDAIYGSELDGRNADKRDLIRYILNQERLQPAQTMMIGDRQHDMLGAKANDVHSGGAVYGYGGHEELTAVGADVLFTTPHQITDYFQEDS